MQIAVAVECVRFEFSQTCFHLLPLLLLLERLAQQLWLPGVRPGGGVCGALPFTGGGVGTAPSDAEQVLHMPPCRRAGVQPLGSQQDRKQRLEALGPLLERQRVLTPSQASQAERARASTQYALGCRRTSNRRVRSGSAVTVSLTSRVSSSCATSST